MSKRVSNKRSPRRGRHWARSGKEKPVWWIKTRTYPKLIKEIRR